MKKLFFALSLWGGVIAFGNGCSSNDDPINVSGISLNKNTLPLERGQQEKLTASVTPSDAEYDGVVWATSDPSIATVDKGNVTAVATGSATISATAGGQTATCAVTVSVSVSGISLDKPTLDLNISQTYQLQVTVTPTDATDPDIKWNSSDPTTATVSANGTVEAIAQGTTTVTATSGNNKTAQCTVTVRPAAKTWSVGDLYEVDGVKGVVVEVSNGGVNGKIVSMDEAVRLWATVTATIGCDNETDGKGNTQKAKDYNASLSVFPGFKWCVDHGTGWYMPACQEAFLFLKNIDVINPTFTANGGTAIDKDNYYWSSTEASEGMALTVYLEGSTPKSIGDMMDAPEGDTYVRAMFAF